MGEGKEVEREGGEGAGHGWQHNGEDKEMYIGVGGRLGHFYSWLLCLCVFVCVHQLSIVAA